MLSIYLYIHKALHVWYWNLVLYLMQSWFIKSMIHKGNYILLVNYQFELLEVLSNKSKRFYIGTYNWNL